MRGALPHALPHGFTLLVEVFTTILAGAFTTSFADSTLLVRVVTTRAHRRRENSDVRGSVSGEGRGGGCINAPYCPGEIPTFDRLTFFQANNRMPVTPPECKCPFQDLFKDQRHMLSRQ